MGSKKKAVSFCLTSLLGLGLMAVSVTGAENSRTVSAGISIEGEDIGGMSIEEVKGVIRSLTDRHGSANVTVDVGGQTLSCTMSDLGLAWSNTEVLEQILNMGTTGNIVQRYKDQKDLQQENVDFTLEYQIDSERTLQWAAQLSQFDSEPENASIYTTGDLTPGVSGGTDGITVNIEETAARIEEAALAWDGSSDISVEAVADRVEPDVTYEDMAKISDVLGTATTDYSASSGARAANVENGCSKITGTLLYPGEGFSVTDALVPFNAENGYYEAPSYEENRVVNSYGGGICQVSTTLYNAVLKSELSVTQRSNHTMVVSYVDLSKDAAIAEGVMDLVFYNSLEDPVYIIGYCWGGQITFTVYGHETRPSNRSISFESVTTATIEPTQAKLYANGSQAVGYINQTQSSHTGYQAELWKHIYVDGVLTDSVQVNSSYYTAVGTIYDVGVLTDNAALSSAIYTAIATNDISQVQAVIANASSYQTQTEAPADTTGTVDTTANAAQAAEDAEEAAAVAADDLTIGILQ